MTAKDKAKELFNKFYDLDEFEVQCSMYCNGGYIERKDAAKQCALIAVDEIIDQCKDANFGGFGFYWESVKQELLNLQNNV